MNAIIERAKDFLFRRRRAYERVFPIGTPDVDWVLGDLAKFCRAHASTAHPNERAAALAEGRREVWLRIQHHLRLTDEQLWDLYGRAQGSHLTKGE